MNFSIVCVLFWGIWAVYFGQQSLEHHHLVQLIDGSRCLNTGSTGASVLTTLHCQACLLFSISMIFIAIALVSVLTSSIKRRDVGTQDISVGWGKLVSPMR